MKYSNITSAYECHCSCYPVCVVTMVFNTRLAHLLLSVAILGTIESALQPPNTDYAPP